MARHGYSAYSHGCRCATCRRAAATYRRHWRRGYRWTDNSPAARAARLEDYTELRSWGLTRREAAARLGVTMRTLDRYDAALRQRAA